MIPPITRNRWSGARTEPAIISPAISTSTRPTPVPISHSQLLVSVEINVLNAPAPGRCGAVQPCRAQRSQLGAGARERDRRGNDERPTTHSDCHRPSSISSG